MMTKTFKVGDTIYCMCELDCGCNGTIRSFSGQMIIFNDGSVEFLPDIEKYWVNESDYLTLKHSPLALALNEKEDTDE
jgi:hypothetical protein